MIGKAEKIDTCFGHMKVGIKERLFSHRRKAGDTDCRSANSIANAGAFDNGKVIFDMDQFSAHAV